MNHRSKKLAQLLRIVFAALLLSVCSTELLAAPNIIVFYTDDHGWPDIGAADIYEDLKTPHIDALAASGVRATSGYSTAPQCVPSRAGLLAGRAQNRFGVESNGKDLAGFDAQVTIGERLQSVGYRTGQFGKWHLGKGGDIPTHGFHAVYNKNANRPCLANITLAGETVPMALDTDKLYHIDACSQAADGFIRQTVGTQPAAAPPLFLYIAYRAPHVPLDAPQSYLERFPGEMPERRRQALAMIAAMDDGVGKITATLKELGIEKNTLIFFIGDNGAPLKIHKLDLPGAGPGWDGSLNAPMNGEKGMLSEGGIRVPFVVSWPGTIPAGQVYDHPVSALDVAATAAALAKTEEVPGQPLDGVNLIPFLSGRASGAPHEALTWRWLSQSAIRHGDWKYLRAGKREYLFDLKVDASEQHNLAAAQPERLQQLRARLRTWTRELDPPGFSEDPSGAVSSFFDHYLDGKPQALTAQVRANAEARAGLSGKKKAAEQETNAGTAKRAAKADADIAPFVTRNALAKRGSEGMEIRPKKDGHRPFLVLNQLDLDGAFDVAVAFGAPAAGSVQVAWRSEGQATFAAEQIVEQARGAKDAGELKLQVPAKGKTVHLRLILPAGGATLRSVRVGKKIYRFAPPL